MDKSRPTNKVGLEQPIRTQRLSRKKKQNKQKKKKINKTNNNKKKKSKKKKKQDPNNLTAVIERRPAVLGVTSQTPTK